MTILFPSETGEETMHIGENSNLCVNLWIVNKSGDIVDFYMDEEDSKELLRILNKRIKQLKR